jgi:hypothetical protein
VARARRLATSHYRPRSKERVVVRNGRGRKARDGPADATHEAELLRCLLSSRAELFHGNDSEGNEVTHGAAQVILRYLLL